MNISIVNRQKTLRVNRGALRTLTEMIGKRALPDPAAWEAITVILVHDREMVEVNRACFGRTGETDVISIPYPPFPPGIRAGRGEIVVNADQAYREGKKRAGPSRELALYVAHGCNHLGGRDDPTPSERIRMRHRENAWLRRPDIQPWIESCLEERRTDA